MKNHKQRVTAIVQKMLQTQRQNVTKSSGGHAQTSWRFAVPESEQCHGSLLLPFEQEESDSPQTSVRRVNGTALDGKVDYLGESQFNRE